MRVRSVGCMDGVFREAEGAHNEIALKVRSERGV